MRVLWLCGIVLPEFCREYGIKPRNTGGWLTGMLHAVRMRKEIELGLCFPIVDRSRMKDGKKGPHQYYAFPNVSVFESEACQEERFCEIIQDFKPDIIHIWGTEWLHTYSMLKACRRLGMADHTVTNIQGLVYLCAEHFCDGLAAENLEKDPSFAQDLELFVQRGKIEKQSVALSKNMIGRTDWDEAFVKQENPDIRYFHAGEILRDIFYEKAGSWSAAACTKHTIFISQAYCPVKGFHYFLQGLPYILDQFPDTVIKVAGWDLRKYDNGYSKYIMDIISKNHWEKQIQFLGMITEEEMCGQFLAAHVFVSCSTIENSSNSVCEAMLLGTPVVASFVGGVPSLMEHNQTGFLYPCDEPNMMAYYVTRLFEDSKLAQDLSYKETERASELVNREQSCLKTVQIYESLLRS